LFVKKFYLLTHLFPIKFQKFEGFEEWKEKNIKKKGILWKDVQVGVITQKSAKNTRD
jgi:hypothetical protein